jgi:polysaccharide deacetylase family protein (PEP-CTERM system associated)
VQNNSLFTIDVEDYFHICEVSGAPRISQWDNIPGRVEINLLKLFDILDRFNVKSTCFFLGYIANKYPCLVKEADNRGHEIASHGMYHQLVYEMTKAEFFKDVVDSKHLLEDILGKQVTGYRCPSFSVTSKTPWFFDKLVEAGYQYDSSVFPAQRGCGGIKTDLIFPHWINIKEGNMFEFPISVGKVMGKNICFFGGGYLRLFPISLITKMADILKQKGVPVLYYLHPREIDISHPRLKMNPFRYFKSYVNMKTVLPKLDIILKSGDFVTCSNYLTKYVSEI